jgi:hypothetical protein
MSGTSVPTTNKGHWAREKVNLWESLDGLSFVQKNCGPHHSSIVILPVSIAPTMATKSDQRPVSSFKSDDFGGEAAKALLIASDESGG